MAQSNEFLSSDFLLLLECHTLVKIDEERNAFSSISSLNFQQNLLIWIANTEALSSSAGIPLDIRHRLLFFRLWITKNDSSVVAIQKFRKKRPLWGSVLNLHFSWPVLLYTYSGVTNCRVDWPIYLFCFVVVVFQSPLFSEVRELTRYEFS